MRAITARLAGRRHHAVELRADGVFALRREPENPADRSAVAVTVDGETAGYLEAGLATLVAPLLDHERPVFVAHGKAETVTLYVPERGEHAPDTRGSSLVRVASGDGRRSYVVDRRRGLCTCPAGRYVRCKHQRAIGIGG